MNDSLATQNWTVVSPHEVYLAFLRGEYTRIPSEAARLAARKLLEHPNLTDADENCSRFLFLMSIRGPLLQRIPYSTKWYCVRFLRQEHLPQLRVIARCGWDSMTKSDENELLNVVKREHPTLKERPEQWVPPILWGHDKDSPLTILEGNNRLLAYAADPRPKLEIPFYVGLSDDLCFFHYLDPVG
jgi:hypothetical protein